MLSQRQGHTPQKAQPHFPANRVFQRLITLNRPPSPRLCSQQLAAPREEPPFTGWTRHPPIGRARPMRIQARQERVEFAPAGSSGWGRGASSCYTFCESGAHGRKGKQSRPTHSLTLVNTAATGYTQTHTDLLSSPPDKIHSRPLRQRLLFHPIVRFQIPAHTRTGGKAVVEGHAWATRAHNHKTPSPSGRLITASELG